MAEPAPLAYLDASALVKLVVPEPESESLRGELIHWPRRATSTLVRTELVRACARIGSRARERASEVVEGLTLVSVSDELLDLAAAVEPRSLRSLDAIHVATALTLRQALGAVITYDERLAGAAARAGLPLLSPR